MSTRSSVRFGINYTPSRKWYYLWNDWDRGEVEADLCAVRALGVDHLRIQLIWPWFQPNRTYVSPGHLERLKELMSIAEDLELDVLPCLLTGFLSGWLFLPPGVKKRDVYLDPETIRSQQLFARTVFEAIGTRPNFMGFDLGNEINCIDHDLPPEKGEQWAEDYCAFLRPMLGDLLLVNGVDHFPWLAGSTFRPDHLANGPYDTLTLHCWPAFTGCLEKGPLDGPASLHLTAFFSQWARAFARDRRRPIWVQEFGCASVWGTPGEQETYLRRGVELAIAAGVSMFTFWCSHDKPRTFDFHEWEYHYGLLTPDNQEKPMAPVFRELVRRFAGRAVAVPAPEDFDTLIVLPEGFSPRLDSSIPLEDWMRRTLSSDFWKIYPVFLQRVLEGAQVQLVRESELSQWRGTWTREVLDARELMSLSLS